MTSSNNSSVIFFLLSFYCFCSLGAFSLAVSSGSKIELSPQLDEVPKLYEWYMTERGSIDAKTISMASGGSDAFGTLLNNPHS